MTDKEIETCREELMEDFEHPAISIDDTLTEILIRLPPESIAKFRQVSKRWSDLITSPSFLRSYRLRKEASSATTSLLGFFHKSFKPLEPRVSYFPAMDTTNYDLPRHLSDELGFLIASSNGFLLFDDHSRKYHIVNPITKLCVSLPSPTKYNSWNSVGLFCQPSDDLVLHYIVVFVDPSQFISNKLCIETYSSETREWRESTLVATSDFSSEYYSFGGPTVVGGVFYWLAFLFSTFAVYDPKESRRQNHLQLIEHPMIEGSYLNCSYSLSKSLNGILRYGSNSYRGIVDIWELPKGEEGYIRSTTIPREEWVLKYTVTLPALRIEHPMLESHLEEKLHGLPYKLLIPFLREPVLVDFIPGSPLMVLLRLGMRVYSYNLESKVLEALIEFQGWPRKNLYPYFEPLFLSPFIIHPSQRVEN